MPPYNVTADDIVIGSGFVVNLDQNVTINRTGLLASASLTVDGELRSNTAGLTLTMTRGDLNGVMPDERRRRVAGRDEKERQQ